VANITFSLLALALAVGSTSCAKKVVVPDVTQQDISQAGKTLAASQLKVGTVTGIPSGTTASTIVLSQSPKAGEQASVSSAVDLVASLAVVVPDLTNSKVSDAGTTLQALGLKVGTVSGVPAASVAGAMVMSENPAAGQNVAANSAVDLVAALPIVLPDLTKSKLTDAVNTLQALGLKMSLIKQSTVNIFARGGVKQQTPAANTPVLPGSTVSLTVEVGPDISALLGVATQEPAYEKLNPEYRKVLDEFLKPPAAATTTTPVTPPAGTPPPPKPNTMAGAKPPVKH
jgi:beta-lactam-binding protein with PASTA domain